MDGFFTSFKFFPTASLIFLMLAVAGAVVDDKLFVLKVELGKLANELLRPDTLVFDKAEVELLPDKGFFNKLLLADVNEPVPGRAVLVAGKLKPVEAVVLPSEPGIMFLDKGFVLLVCPEKSDVRLEFAG
jgi:hypothetical protein